MVRKKSGDVPPVREETLRAYAQSLFKPLNRGESVTAVWVPMAGRRTVTKYILAHPELVAEEIGEIDSFCLSYVEPMELTEESINGYLNLVGNSIIHCAKLNPGLEWLLPDWKDAFTSNGADYSETLDKLRNFLNTVITDGEKRVVLFLGKFDEISFANSIFYDNLKSLLMQHQPDLQYVFLVSEDITQYDSIKKYAGLIETILQNVIYVPILDDEDGRYVIDKVEKLLEERFSAQDRETLTEVCGNHPYFLKASCRILSSIKDRSKLSKDDLVELLLDHHELKLAARGIWETRGEKEKDALLKILDSQLIVLPDEVKTLRKLGLVVPKEKGGYRLFSPLLEGVIYRREQKLRPADKIKKVKLDSETGAILLGDRPIEEKFTRQEYEILHHLMLNPNVLRSRDDIGGVLWGENMYEKYSDWAIDKLMSKIRKKLKELGVSERTLITIRGRGYKFVQS